LGWEEKAEGGKSKFFGGLSSEDFPELRLNKLFRLLASYRDRFQRAGDREHHQNILPRFSPGISGVFA
jgi:hypothetical protein